MTWTRRRLLGAAAATAAFPVLPVLAACAPGRPATEGDRAPVRHAYAGEHPDQFGELYRPHGTSRGTVVVIHGGYWRNPYGLEYGEDLARDLSRRGYTCWNLEYRRVGDGGGWPNTFADVAKGIDHLTRLDVDTDRVLTLGHSAGGQLAVWAAARGDDPTLPGGAAAVRVRGAISQAGVLDLRTAALDGAGGGAVSDALGGTPDQVPARYAAVDPIERLPTGVPVRCVHGDQDTVVPLSQSGAYVAAAVAAGDDASLVRVAGGHFTLIDTDGPVWARTRGLVDDLADA